MDNIIKRRKFTNTIVLALGLLLFFNSQTVYGRDSITMLETILRMDSNDEVIVKFEIVSKKNNYIILKNGCYKPTCFYDLSLFESGFYEVVVTTKSGRKFRGKIKK